MFEVLIREAGARFGLGDKAEQLVSMLLATMINRETGGLAGFLEKFKAAELGPIIQSWLGGGPTDRPISNDQLEQVLGAPNGLISTLSGRLDLGRENVTSALGYLLPAIVGKLTPGGSIPTSIPAEIAALASQGQDLLSGAGAMAADAARGGSGLGKWLPWAVVALAVLLGLGYCSTQNKQADEPAVAPAVQQTAPAEPAVVPVPEPAEDAAAAEPADSAATDTAPAAEGTDEQPAADTSAEGADAADADDATPLEASGGGASVLAVERDGRPALEVYFNSGKSDVGAGFSEHAGELVAYMQENPEVQAVISGFNDASGSAAANEEISRDRALAVQIALVAEGIAEERTRLEKPTQATDTGGSAAQSRRVEVVLAAE